MFERFSRAAREVVKGAQREAWQACHPTIGTGHLLLALLADREGVAHQVLTSAGVDEGQVRAGLDRLAGVPSKPLGEADAAALATIGIDLDAVLSRIEETFGVDALEVDQQPARRGLFGRRASANPRFSPRSKKVLELSLREAIRLRHRTIGAEHILLGLLRDGGGAGARILVEAGVDLDGLRRATVAALEEAA